MVDLSIHFSRERDIEKERERELKNRFSAKFEAFAASVWRVECV